MLKGKTMEIWINGKKVMDLNEAEDVNIDFVASEKEKLNSKPSFLSKFFSNRKYSNNVSDNYGSTVVINGNGVSYKSNKKSAIIRGKVIIEIKGDAGNVSTTFGDISISGSCLGIKSSSGDISVKGDAKSVSTSSGDINVEGSISGNAETVSGNIKAGKIIGNVKTISGTIKG